MNTKYDYLLVGGGLQNVLVAAALARWQPEATVALLERDDRLAGNHTWSFYQNDVSPELLESLEPFLVGKWLGYRVQFPGFSRRVPQKYYAMTSDHVDQVLRDWFKQRANWELCLNRSVQSVYAHQVVLDDGTELEGKAVIDARGPDTNQRQTNDCGFQKFFGQEVNLQQPWPGTEPVIMDAQVPQEDGFRFVYVLPLTNHRILVEETYFSDSPQLDREHLRGRIEQFLADHQVEANQILREESGVLPMPWGSRWQVVPIPNAGPFLAGYAGGWFHPATGYSVCVAARVAEAIAQGSVAEIPQRLRSLAGQLAWRQRFGRILNWMAFRLIRPEYRWGLYRRFYRMLSSAAISRFYSLKFTSWDATRLVVGWPPAGITFKHLLRVGGPSS